MSEADTHHAQNPAINATVLAILRSIPTVDFDSSVGAANEIHLMASQQLVGSLCLKPLQSAVYD